MTVTDLPFFNACMNGVASVFLVLGFIAVKKKSYIVHRNMMLCALTASTIFLSSYLYYHFNVQLVTRYPGTGPMRTLYLAILCTHIPLATGMVPFILFIVWKAFKEDFERHKKIARFVWPVWMYVSVTGIIIYNMLYNGAWS